MSSKILGCPNSSCSNQRHFKKDGHYYRKNDSRFVQRFQCLVCNKKFSKSTFEFEYRHKKRRVNWPLFKLLASGVSQRRSAILLRVNFKTVAKKFDYLAKKYAHKNELWLKSLTPGGIDHVQFDDLITIEHTKLKPLTVTTFVDAKTRHILSAEVGAIPAFGLLAAKSRAKYGPRKNEHPETLSRALAKITKAISPDALFESDDHQLYPKILKKFFPNSTHHSYKGGRGCVSGQGELKKLTFDPLFSINHTYAMLRANINRLFRKTWCTTKGLDKLKQHLEIYIWFHNHIILQ